MQKPEKTTNLKSPTPEQVVAARLKFNFTQKEAGEIVYSKLRTWQGWEAGTAKMHPGLWELFCLKTEGMTHPLASRLDPSRPPDPIVPPELWADFCEWARDGGYDESYFNRWDSKSIALQEEYLVELGESS